jgi:hypothetical protein
MTNINTWQEQRDAKREKKRESKTKTKTMFKIKDMYSRYIREERLLFTIYEFNKKREEGRGTKKVRKE